MTPKATDQGGVPQKLACRREFPERSYERCGKPAEFIVWGKLFPKEALGPRCRDCLEDQCGHRAPGDPSYAIYHLPELPALRKLHREEFEEELKRLEGERDKLREEQRAAIAHDEASKISTGSQAALSSIRERDRG